MRLPAMPMNFTDSQVPGVSSMAAMSARICWGAAKIESTLNMSMARSASSPDDAKHMVAPDCRLRSTSLKPQRIEVPTSRRFRLDPSHQCR